MNEKNELDLLDYVLFLLKCKKILLGIFFSSLIIAYLTIYFFVDEVFEANSVILPVENTDMTGLSMLTKSLGSLPLGLGKSFGGGNGANTDLFMTILYSRSNLDTIINKFNLMQEYEIEKKEEARKALIANIFSDETKEGAFSISVRSKTPEKAAEMANYIVSQLNKRVIEMNITKSRSNKEFLKNRQDEIKANLKQAEEQLTKYQRTSNMIEAESQVKALMEEYIKMESELEKRRFEYNMLKTTLGGENPQVLAAQGAMLEYEKMVSRVKSEGLDNSFFVGANKIPEEAMNYFRLYREVQIYNEMLTFIVPMYEKASFEEQNDMPVIQVIDKAVPPEKRVYPQRVFTSGIIALAVTFFTAVLLLFKEIFNNTENLKLKAVSRELRIFSKRA